MIEADAKPGRRISAPSISPGDPPPEAGIDFAHLARMTMGDKRLEAEVLALFDRQADLLLARMRGAPPAAVAAFAHTIKGSARGVGAWQVAEAAEAIERAAKAPEPADLADALGRLAAAVDAVRAVIMALRPAS
jgi:HPt (histidine-containing phosphotransfer) domain-containing protein